jgi:hypothetical protein
LIRSCVGSTTESRTSSDSGRDLTLIGKTISSLPILRECEWRCDEVRAGETEEVIKLLHAPDKKTNKKRTKNNWEKIKIRREQKTKKNNNSNASDKVFFPHERKKNAYSIQPSSVTAEHAKSLERRFTPSAVTRTAKGTCFERSTRGSSRALTRTKWSLMMMMMMMMMMTMPSVMGVCFHRSYFYVKDYTKHTSTKCKKSNSKSS